MKLIKKENNYQAKDNFRIIENYIEIKDQK
jgi:hypothetical protein